MARSLEVHNSVVHAFDALYNVLPVIEPSLVRRVRVVLARLNEFDSLKSKPTTPSMMPLIYVAE